MSRLVKLAIPAHWCVAASAATLEQLSLDQMTLSATSIVRARVTGLWTSVINSTIYTHYTLQVSETWKGVPATEAMLPGGVSGGNRQSFPGVPELSEDGEYVLFLWTSPSTGIVHVLGMSQGIFLLRHQADGATLATRPKIGEMMLDSAGRKVADHGLSLKVADLKGRVRNPGGMAALDQ
jgi:hypothetical protein